MRIQVLDRQQRLRVSKSALKTIARIALKVEGYSRSSSGSEDLGSVAGAFGGDYDAIGLSLVTDGIMRELNRTYRDLDRTTDVLSFDLRGASYAAEPRAGEVIISTDRVLVQARRYRATPERELARLLIHGLLHLRGFDHHRMGERHRMRAVERVLLGGLAETIPRLVLGVR